MRLLLKRVGVFLLFATVIFLILPVFLNPDYKVERSRVINAPIDSLYEKVSDLNNWELWDSWQQIDYYSRWKVEEGERKWISRNPRVRNGSMAIVDKGKNDFVNYRVYLADENLEILPKIQFKPLDSGVEVSYAIQDDFSYFERYRNLFYDFEGEMGKQIDLSLFYLAALYGDTLSY